MFTLKIENKRNEQLTLTQNESKYQIINITGLNPPSADITTVQIANMDGEKFKTSRLQMRNVVITIKINGDVEKNRISLYNYFRTGQYCKIYYSNDSRNIFCEGYVETIETELFTISQEIQISIICPDSYLHDINLITTDISKTFGIFNFPFSIESSGIEFSTFDSDRQALVINQGEVETGIIIKLIATGDNIVNPIIYNADNGNWFALNITLNTGDEIIINTNKGLKSVKKISDGIESNVMNTIASNSTWLQLTTGSTFFTYDAEINVELLNVIFTNEILYEGV